MNKPFHRKIRISNHTRHSQSKVVIMYTKSLSMALRMEAADQWFHDVKLNFKKQLESKVVADVCVFQVPKSLRTVKPEDYDPQMIGLGPYNHLKPELQEMERIKLDATCRLLKGFQVQDFDYLTDKLAKLDPYVRACYHKNLDSFDENKLAWIMAVDSAFLFYFLCHHSIDPKTLESSPHLRDTVGPVGRKLAEDAILRDVMMLENQVPIFFIKQMLALLCSRHQDGRDNDDGKDNGNDERKYISEEMFPQMLVRFCEALSPFQWTTKDPPSKALKRAHLLDLLYSIVLPREDEFRIHIPPHINEDQSEAHKEKASVLEKIEEYGTKVAGFIEECIEDCKTNIAESGLATTMPKIVDALVDSKALPMENEVKPHANMVKGLLDVKFTELTKALFSSHRKAAVAEDFLLPRASQLTNAGVIFKKAKTIQDISFDQTKAMLYLPVIQISVNSEVIIRNLVAYEAMVVPKSLKFARYVELMSGLIDTVEDVKLLRDSNILISHMRDDEVTTIFNSTTKSIQLSNDGDIDRTIRKLNKFYNESTNIKVRKAGKLFAYGFWRSLALVAVIIYLLLMFLQSFCSAYDCARLYSTSVSNAT